MLSMNEQRSLTCSMGNLRIICEKISTQRFSTGSCPIKSLVSPKKSLKLRFLGKSLWSKLKLGIRNRDIREFQTQLSPVSFRVRSSTGDEKRPQSAHYVRRMRFSKCSEFYFLRYFNFCYRGGNFQREYDV